MSAAAQLAAIASFLIYSLVFMLFVGWASHRSAARPPSSRRKKLFLAGFVFPLTILVVSLLRL